MKLCILAFQTLEIFFLVFWNIGILYFGISKHWNSVFQYFQIIGILDFAISKH